MRILVTGAAGNLGRRLVGELHVAGHEVVATDLKESTDLPVTLHECDLTEAMGVYPLLKDCDGVIHAGNHANTFFVNPMQRALTENVAMTGNVFMAARELGTPRIIFISSVQAVAGNNGMRDAIGPLPPPHQPYLPMDEKLPQKPGVNPYAQSKALGENYLQEMAAINPQLAAVSMRLPYIHMRDVEVGQRYFKPVKPGDRRAEEGFGFLTVSDTVRLLRACIEKMTPGYRTYFPAQSCRIEGMGVREVAKTFLPDAEVRSSIDEVDSLIDIRGVCRELDWQPSQTPPTLPLA